MTKLCLHNEQTINGLRKITRASVFRLIFSIKRQHIYRYIYVYLYIYLCISISNYINMQKAELTENCNFCLFAANGKQKWRLPQTQMENESLFFLDSKRLTVIDDCCFTKRAHLWFLCLKSGICILWEAPCSTGSTSARIRNFSASQIQSCFFLYKSGFFIVGHPHDQVWRIQGPGVLA
jgi:hypothetical protein